MKLTQHEEKVLELVHQHPEIVDDREVRKQIAEQEGLSEKTLRNRIADLKKYGILDQLSNKKIEVNEPGSDSSTFLLNIKKIYNNRKFIIFNTILFTSIAMITVFIIPKWYRSTAVVVSTGQQNSNLLSMFSDIPLGDFGLSAVNDEISTYIAVLKSRTLRESIINKYDLIHRYEEEDIEKTLEKFDQYFEYKLTEEGTLEISMLDKNPQFAQTILNGVLLKLNEISISMRKEKGKFSRKFFEKRLKQARLDLGTAEDSLNSFQNSQGIYDIPSQVEAEIQTYSQIYAEKVKTDLELAVQKTMTSETDPKIIALKRTQNEYQSQLDRFKTGSNLNDIFIPFEEVPDRGLEYSRRYREMTIQSKILEVLYPQYEQAVMEENKSIPAIQILDKPNYPIRKAKPYRALIVGGTFIMAIIFSIMYVYMISWLKNIYIFIRK